MDARLQNRIQRYGWDRAADGYEAAWADQLRPGQDLMLDRAQLASGERVLDVACGTGLVSFRAAELVGPEGYVLGTDISERMVDAARALDGQRGLAFQRMAADELQLDESQFDVALCGFGLMYVPEPVKALAEMRRVLKPGGRVSVSVWGARAKCGWAEIFPIVDSRVESEVCPLFFQLGTGDSLRAAMSHAGFEGVEIARISARLRYGSSEEAIAAAFVAGPVALAHAKFEPQVRAEAHAEYLASIAPYRLPGGGYDLPAEFVVGWGRA